MVYLYNIELISQNSQFNLKNTERAISIILGLKPQPNEVICSTKEKFAKLNISSVCGLYINEVIVSVEPKSETIHLTEMIIIYTTSKIY